MEKQVLSPITKNSDVTKLKSFNVEWIIKQWKRMYSQDVKYLFNGIKTIELFICNQTGYNFFYPEIMGDSKLYENLQKNDWYYMPWKWEHEETTQFLKDNISVLEIGCAEGDFLEKIISKFKIKATGIETNHDTIKKVESKGIKVFEETIQNHSLANKEMYDVICSFQVLEHIADVGSFIESCLLCLKPKGLLIFSVPNNQSFISETDQILNMPPHHAGLWDEHSLRSIASIFNLEIDRIMIEPMQAYHIDFFKFTVYANVLGKRIFNNRVLRKILSVFLMNQKVLISFVHSFLDEKLHLLFRLYL